MCLGLDFSTGLLVKLLVDRSRHEAAVPGRWLRVGQGPFQRELIELADPRLSLAGPTLHQSRRTRHEPTRARGRHDGNSSGQVLADAVLWHGSIPRVR